jgi:hypothetical protein
MLAANWLFLAIGTTILALLSDSVFFHPRYLRNPRLNPSRFIWFDTSLKVVMDLPARGALPPVKVTGMRRKNRLRI